MSNIDTNHSGGQNKNDEIDLIQLFSSISDKFKNLFVGLFNFIGKFLLAIIYFSLRNYIVLLIIVIFSGTVYFVKFTSSVFESNMKVRANAITNQEAISFINKLSELSTPENSSELMKQLSVDSITASQLVDIGAYWYIDEDMDGMGDYIDVENKYFKAEEDSLSRRITSYFNIRIIYKDEINVSLVSQKIFEYVNNNSYFDRANEIRKRNVSETFSLIKLEQQKLDTIRVNYNTAIFENNLVPETKNGQLVFLNGEPNNFQEIKLFHEQIFNLDDRAKKLNRTLELNPDVITIMEDFRASNLPKNSFFSYSKYSILIAVLGLLFTIVFENRKKIIELKKKSAIK